MAVFRIEKTRDYTVMSNHHLRNTELSLKAKGLLSLIMDEHVFEVQGLPVVVTGDLLADALAQLPEDKRDVILLSYFLGMTDREISEKLNVVH